MAESQDLLRVTRSVPQAAFRRVTVHFPSPEVDVAVPHDLNPSDPESIEYHVVRTNGPATIYDDQSETRTPWRTDCIYLRTDGTDIVADLILIRPSPDKPRRPLMIGPYKTFAGVIYLGGSRAVGVQVPP